MATGTQECKLGVLSDQYPGILHDALQTLALFHYPNIRSRSCSVKQFNSPQTKIQNTEDLIFAKPLTMHKKGHKDGSRILQGAPEGVG